MICQHLRRLEAELIDRGIPETFRGKAWTQNCREWVYYNCYLDTKKLLQRLPLSGCVTEHVNDDVRSGTERGLYCAEHHDAIVGLYEPLEDRPIVQ